MSNERSRDWCFTLNNYTDEDIAMLDNMSSTTQYIIYGKEVAETGTNHLQGYVYFADAKSFSKMKKTLPSGSHIEKTKGTPQQASEYCKKENNYVEYGALPEKQGKRNDIKKVKELIEQGKTMSDIIEVSTSYQSLRTAELLYKYKEKPRNYKPNVIWIHGPSGTGKTRLAYEMFPDVYRKTNSSGKWFEGYDGHKNVLFDDIKDTSREYWAFLLEALDRYECRVECKGASRQFLGQNIVCTSICRPDLLYFHFNEAKELMRRIDKVIDIEIYLGETT